jgi:hypothetical protein
LYMVAGPELIWLIRESAFRKVVESVLWAVAEYCASSRKAAAANINFRRCMIINFYSCE